MASKNGNVHGVSTIQNEYPELSVCVLLTENGIQYIEPVRT
jgi:hypothetical protein